MTSQTAMTAFTHSHDDEGIEYGLCVTQEAGGLYAVREWRRASGPGTHGQPGRQVGALAKTYMEAEARCRANARD